MNQGSLLFSPRSVVSKYERFRSIPYRKHGAPATHGLVFGFGSANAFVFLVLYVP